MHLPCIHADYKLEHFVETKRFGVVSRNCFNLSQCCTDYSVNIWPQHFSIIPTFIQTFWEILVFRYVSQAPNTHTNYVDCL